MSELSSEKIFGIVFIAFFSVFTSCAEVNLFNKNINNDSTILPHVKLGAEIRDDCFSGTIALEESLNFVLNAFRQSEKICKNAINRAPPVIGVIGTVASHTTMAVASMLRLFKVPQISYGATSPDLSNRDEYTYFMRTLPSDVCQAQALFDITVKLGWSAVFLISSPLIYGKGLRKKFLKLARERHLCIVDDMEMSTKIQLREQQISSFLQRINLRQSVRGVVLLTESIYTKKILEKARDLAISPGRFRWLGTDTWGTGQNLRGIEEIANGAISISVHNSTARSLQKFNDYFLALKPAVENVRNPWFKEFYHEYFNCSNFSASCSGNELNVFNDNKIPHVIDAVYAFAYSLEAMLGTTNQSLEVNRQLEELSAKGVDFLDFLMNVSFIGRSGLVSFDVNGDGIPRYDIMSYNDKKYQKIAIWKNGNFISIDLWFENLAGNERYTSYCGEKCKFGQGRLTSQDAPPCCWSCYNCALNEYVNSSSHLCQSCDIHQRLNRNKTRCVTLLEVGPTKWVVILLTTWGSMGLLATFFVAFTIYKFYSTPVIMASGRELMLVLLAGIALSFGLGFVLLGEPSRRNCVFQRFGSGVFLAMCYSAIFVKTNRVARIFRGDTRPAFISPRSQLLITSILVSLQLGICMIASVFGTRSEVTEFYEHEHFHKICRTSGKEYVVSISYNVFLLLLCTFYAFLTRKLPANFNEARLVGITVYTTCVQWICFFPLFYGTLPVYHTSVLLLNSCINATVLLLGMFAPKVYLVWFQQEKNTREGSNPRERETNKTSSELNDCSQSVHGMDRLVQS
ncbi:metabotropic glutamate receptor 1-like isoform X2 [Xenia sp. Carnegie-2017]|uniref:metabotropic glutamate receptor 1-like isoform X2 n=1 Tax=Xenia sp. Carnegie-2017 TaxID=2897299 RepID=UPI001F04E511|nr:metabotropic glutamate receptor 1-like isoform X2 [Xenia sp. Carnegie-2017]